MNPVSHARISHFIIAVLLAFIAISIPSIALSGNKVTLQIPVCYPTALPGLGSGIVYFAEHIEAESSGKVGAEIHEPNKLLSPYKILDAVSKGEVNAGFSTSLYWIRKMPEIVFFSGGFPFAASPREHYDWIMNRGGLERYQRVYDTNGYNVKVIPVCLIGADGFGWFKKPLESASDFKGLRMRFYGLSGKVMKELGVSVFLVPAGEIYASFENGKINAAEFSTPQIDKRLKFWEVAKYYYYPGWHQPSVLFDLLINKDVWNSMSQDQQRAIENLSRKTTLHEISEFENTVTETIELLKNKGVIHSKVPPRILDAVYDAWQTVAAAEGRHRPQFKEEYDNYTRYFPSKTILAEMKTGVKQTKKDVAQASSRPKPSGRSEKTKDTVVDKTPPAIKILSHDMNKPNTVDHSGKKVKITGKASDTSGVVEVMINNKDAVIDASGNFFAYVYLKPGENSIRIAAMDVNENRSHKTLTIRREFESMVQNRPEKSKPAYPAQTGNYYALLIGINDYQYLPKLETAVKDARVVGKILQKNYGFTVQVLVDATRGEILRQINKFRRTLKPDDFFLVYYAGHGEFDTAAQKAYWLPVNAAHDDDTQWIIADNITSNMKRISSKHILIVSDSCYSGTLTRRTLTDLAGSEARHRYIAKMTKKNSRTLLASGGNEPVADSGSNGHSVFAQSLIEGLKEIELPVFTAEELFYHHIKEQVAGNADQTPEYNTIRNSGHNGGDFIFRQK